MTNNIDKANRLMRSNNYDELEKVKNDLMSPNNSLKNVGLLVESVINLHKTGGE